MAERETLHVGTLTVDNPIKYRVTPSATNVTAVAPQPLAYLIGPTLTLAVATSTVQKMIEIPAGFIVNSVTHQTVVKPAKSTHTLTLGDLDGTTYGPTGGAGDVDGWDTAIDTFVTALTAAACDGAYVVTGGTPYTVDGAIYAVHTVGSGPDTGGTHRLIVLGSFAP
jgi:hypothetical protein